MYVRGSNQGIEYKRDDQSFYKGIVVKNNDIDMLFRCKIYLPEVSNVANTDIYLKENQRVPGGVNNIYMPDNKAL